jgi:hypothetical protein
MENPPSRAIHRLTIAIGIVAIVGLVAIILFFTVGGVWGPLNDLSIAAEALLSAALAWMLHPLFHRLSSRFSQVMLGVAIVGSLIASIGSAFVIFSVTGYFLAGLIMGLGYAFLGIWFFAFNYRARLHDALPRGLTQFGQIAGASMAIGFANISGILGQVDSPADASWIENLGQLGWLGWIFLPIWSVWLGRVVLKSTQEMHHE